MSNNNNRQLIWAKKQTKYAWAKYYEACDQQREVTLEFVSNMRQQMEANNNLPSVLVNEFKSIIEKYKHKYQCSICLDDIKDGKKMDVVRCGHFYHKECINGWLNNNNTCPLCRRKIKS